MFMISFFGPLLKLPRAILDLSAFEHVPRLPGGSVDAVPLVVVNRGGRLVVGGVRGVPACSIVSYRPHRRRRGTTEPA